MPEPPVHADASASRKRTSSPHVYPDPKEGRKAGTLICQAWPIV